MNIQLIINILIGCLLVGWLIYTGVNFLKKRKKGLYIKPEAHQSIADEGLEYVDSIEPLNQMVKSIDTRIYEEQGNRTYTYTIGIQLTNKPFHERTFYGFNENVTRDDILKQFFFVNDREILFVEDDGEHHYNQNNIEEITYNVRKILNPVKETEDVLSDVQETTEKTEVSEEFKSSLDDELVNESFKMNDREPLESTNYDKSKIKGRYFKKTKFKQPSVKKYQAKTFNRWFFFGLIVFLLIAPFSLMRTFGISGRIDTLEKTTKKEIKAVGQQANGDVSQSNSYRLNSFMESFLSAYIPVSSDSDSQTKRTEELKRYFANNIKDGFEVEGVERSLDSMTMIDWQPTNNVSTVSYEVTYSTKTIDKGKVSTDSIGSKAVYMMSYVEKGDGFSIVALPSIVKEPTLTRYFDGVTEEERGTALKGTDETNVQKFIELFMSKYATGTKEELEYYMTDVESMGKGYTFDSIRSIQSYDKDGFIHSYVQVYFVNDEDKSKHSEDFSLKIKKDKDQFKIETLNHYLGGLTSEK